MTGSCTGNSCTSDVRLKQNVKPLTGALDTLLQLKGVTFEWKNPEEHNNHTGTQAGIIAQDVEKVMPQWVGENKKGFKTVDPDARTMLGMTVEAFREVNDRLKVVETENDALKKQAAKQQVQLDKQQAEIDEIKHGRDPISHGPGFGPGMLALLAAVFAGGTGLAMKLALRRVGLSLATVVGLLLAGRKKDEEKRS
jgi:Chaperone of endosialidase